MGSPLFKRERHHMAGQHKANLAEAATVLPPSHRMTFEEFLQSDFINAEWVAGEVIELPNPSLRHQILLSFLTTLLNLFAEEGRLGLAVAAPFKMKPGESSPGRQPDVLYVATDRQGLFEKQYLAGAADIAVEIISPQSRTRDSVEKFEEYQRGGVREYWLIDPLREEASFYRLDGNGHYQPIPVGKDGIFRSSALSGFWMRVAWLWQDPLPTVLSVLREWRLV